MKKIHKHIVYRYSVNVNTLIALNNKYLSSYVQGHKLINISILTLLCMLVRTKIINTKCVKSH